nr:retrotransposon protein, putative, Ty1-copia subclass [Tanacetum cinerariifolium]
MEPLHAQEMLRELKTLFAEQAEQELLQTTRDFHSCRQEEGQSVSSYVLKMKGYIDTLERLGHSVTLGLGVSLILIGLHKEYDSFVQNYNMHSMGKTVNELHAVLKLHEQTLPKNNAHALNAIRAGKNKHAYAPKPKIPPPPKTEDPAKDSICHERGEIGHWKRNCPQYLAELLKKKKNVASGAGGSGDGIFEIDFSNSHTNESSIYVASNKRAKLDLDYALLWHCLLGHISKKCIEKLQHDGLLDSSDLKAFEKCVSCMSRKMARKPYTHQVERAKDLLGLIHTDVCGPFKIMSRQRASYFVTFTDDFSRYGYVYLLKHKHEVFETFKVFQKEVENQSGKTIKSLRSNRRGEYMSQEFLDHLKDHGIIVHRTPPYTPQHNGVLERRNRTLLDMVRSMMSQTTLPKSFWDYALETAARILNMVPTKKVKKTSYEVWHGKAPELSYLKVWGYPKETMGYSFYYQPKKKLLVARNAEFLENSLINLKASGSNIIFLILYVDDILIMGNNIPMLQSVKTYLGRCFAMKDLGEAAYILGIKIYRDRSRRLIGLCQSAYIKKNLKAVLHGEFQTCSIMYAVRCTRPDVAFAQIVTSRFQQNPGDIHWTTVKNILKYLMNTKDMFLVYKGDLKRELRVSCYTDAGYLMDADDIKSQSGYVFVLNGGAVDWKSAKQSIFATSSAEAEHVTAFYASKEAVWVRKFISGLGVVPTIEEPISMYCDNTGAIVVANESGITKGVRHFRVKVHYLCEVIEYGDIKLEKVHTYDNLDDPFTKSLAFPKHSEHTRNIGMLPASSLM